MSGLDESDKLYIIQFSVTLSPDFGDVNGLIFHRAMRARNDDDLKRKLKKLQTDWYEKHEEKWNSMIFWNVTETPIEQMDMFFITDVSIGEY